MANQGLDYDNFYCIKATKLIVNIFCYVSNFKLCKLGEKKKTTIV